MRPRSTFEILEPRRLLSGSPAISIGDVSRAEGDAGATAFVFTVSLSAPSSKQVSVKYATESWTASAFAGDNDYKPVSGTLNFARGETTKTIAVLVYGDTRVEDNDVFVVNLRSPRNAAIAKGQGVGLILNDDDPPTPPPPYDIPEQPGDPGTECTPDNPYYPNC